MHTIRSRRFSSVHFWHLVVLFVLVCGQLSTSVVAAQTTPERHIHHYRRVSDAIVITD